MRNRWHWFSDDYVHNAGGIGVSAHDTVTEAFAANDAFQKAEAVGRHIRTKIVTLKDQLQAGMAVQSAHLAESK
jgi:hypothetical protein